MRLNSWSFRDSRLRVQSGDQKWKIDRLKSFAIMAVSRRFFEESVDVMKMQIVSCPHCGTSLLEDSEQCHGCGHALEHQPEAQKPTKLSGLKTLPTDNAVDEDMEACPSCGETCRTGLVRCWSCSTFLRPEIEASYRKMQETSRIEIEHIDLPVIESSTVTEEDSYQRRAATPESAYTARPYAVEDASDDDGFDLSSEAQFGSAEDESSLDDVDFGAPLGDADDVPFELGSNLQLSEDIGQQIASVDPEGIPLQASSEEPPVRGESDEPPVRATMDATEQTAAETAALAAAAASAPDEELLKIAADEELDIQRVRKSLRSKDTFVIFCPQGCRIRVKERHRGKSGKCPRCQSEFVVPRKATPKKGDGEGAATAEPVAVSRYKKWLNDIRLHTVDPQKLRIKADSLFNECQAVDIGFSEEDAIVVTLIAGKFGANAKKLPPLRLALVEHFTKQGSFELLVAAGKKIFTKEALGQFMVAQPAPVGVESLFGDIPVFGTNRIAVRIPKTPDATHPQYLSFCLSEFRSFAEALQTVCGIEGMGANTDIPMTDEYKTSKCHLSEAKVQELTKTAYYEKDPGFKLEVSGWRCTACSIVVSEAARASAKLGGVNGKALAKAKCPKCTQKFGNKPLYQLVSAVSEQQPATPPEPESAP